MTTYLAKYVDDIQSETLKFSKLLTRKGKLLVKSAYPPLDLNIHEIVKDKPDLILIDFILWSFKIEGQSVPYLGGTLATRLREAHYDRPLILVSTKNKFRQHADTGQFGNLDDVVFKDDIEANKQVAIYRLIEWIRGYEQLKLVGANNAWNRVVKALAANRRESEKLKSIFPADQGSLISEGVAKVDWSVPGIAHWIHRVLFKYPGILYDSLYAASMLGISERSFLRGDVQKFFAPAKYNGVFANLTPRWWRDRLLTRAFSLIRSEKLEPDIPVSFRLVFAKRYRVKVTPSTCVVTGTKGADAVCYILRKPVLREASLEYSPDDRPSIMDRARVSFKAIRESPELKTEFLSAEGGRLYSKIIKGKYP
jgi:hypothetical protein